MMSNNMKRYEITYYLPESQYPKTQWELGEQALYESLRCIIKQGGYIDIIHSKDAKDNIRRILDVATTEKLKEFKLLESNKENIIKCSKLWEI